ncbi:MAG: hypothetical protein AAF916_09120 [Planctomycetota bacterium]
MNDELVYGSEAALRRNEAIWALVVAIGLGVAWGFASIWTGWRLAWLAPLAGLGLALLWRSAVASPSRGTALGAAGLLVLSSAAAWGTSALVGRQMVSTNELENDPGLVVSAVRDWMFAEGDLVDPIQAQEEAKAAARAAAEAEPSEPETEATPAPTLVIPNHDAQPESDTEAPVASSVPPTVRVETQVRRRLSEMSDDEKRKIVAWYVNQPGGQDARRTVSDRAWRWIDLLWIVAGMWLAYRFSASASSTDDAYDEEEDERYA